MRKISASELGAFLYCQRSWWYARQGERSDNQPEMDLGSQVHRSHSRSVKHAAFMRRVAMVLLIAGIVLLVWSLFS
jgi:CRISPR/Cas system-associated exonuclease Cas4 (RecB family)